MVIKIVKDSFEPQFYVKNEILLKPLNDLYSAKMNENFKFS
jgi:hypothetical protein